MPTPNRSGGRRSGSYSRQRTTNQRTNGQRRTPPAGRGGYGGGRPAGGNDQMTLYVGLGAGALVLVGVLAFLLMSGGDDTVPVAGNPQPGARPAQSTTVNGPAPDVLVPFSDADKTRIRELIERLDEDYDRAKELKDEGFRFQDAQDYEEAQAAWKEAHELLRAMNRGVNDLELQFGEGVWERMEQFMPTENRTLARWGRLQSDISKQLNTSR